MEIFVREVIRRDLYTTLFLVCEIWNHQTGAVGSGRYVMVRENDWLEPVPDEDYVYPKGRWYGSSAWKRKSLKKSNTVENSEQHKDYFKPIWRWSDAMQNDYASRADWCVKSYEEANHPPLVKLGHATDIKVKPGETVNLSARRTSDPDGDNPMYHWWQYEEADSYDGVVKIEDSTRQDAFFDLPDDVTKYQNIHIICKVKDDGTPQLTRYQRVVIKIIP